MSVEALEKKKYSEKSDVWSFGITCIEILTKEDPYPGIPALQASSQVLLGKLRPTISENIHPKLKKILPSCWNNKPENRPTFKELLNQLQSL